MASAPKTQDEPGSPAGVSDINLCRPLGLEDIKTLFALAFRGFRHLSSDGRRAIHDTYGASARYYFRATPTDIEKEATQVITRALLDCSIKEQCIQKLLARVRTLKNELERTVKKRPSKPTSRPSSPKRRRLSTKVTASDNAKDISNL